MDFNSIKHIEHFKQVLSQDKKPISFLISAGCPVAIKIDKKNTPLIPDIKNLTLAISEKLKKDKDYMKLISEVSKAKKDSQNIEMILSFVRTMKYVSDGGEVRGFETKQLEALEKAICEEIKIAVEAVLPNITTPYHKLTRWSHSIQRDCSVEIFTTNYDLLMEQALEEFGVPYFDGFVGSRNSFFDLRALEEDLIPKHWLKLWKIHGSINWVQTASGSVTRTSRKVVEEEKSLIYPSHLKYDQSRKMPYLAFLDRLNAFIKKPSSLLVTSGYSFRDEHINDVIYTALNNNPTSTVIGLLFGKLNAYEQAVELAKKRPNLVLWASDEAIIGGNMGKWIVPDKLEKSQEFLFNNKELTIGDFATFGELLSQLTGVETTSTGGGAADVK